MRKSALMAVLVGIGMATVARGAGVTYETEDGEAFVKLSGRMQLQYHLQDPADGMTTDELKMRRLRLTTVGSTHPDWYGRLQMEFGKGDLSLLDAYFAYEGWDDLAVCIGSYISPFARESIISSKKMQLVERSFTGSHNYAVPDRQAGVHLVGEAASDKLNYGLSVAKAAIDPDNRRIDFDTVISLDSGDDWSEGELICGRVELAPFGNFSYAQGDFRGDMRLAVALAAFAWQNDDDNLDAARSNDVDTVSGFEISAAFRGGGFSVDAEYHRAESELSDSGITEGIYVDSETTLDVWSIEGGCMLIAGKLEVVGGYDELDADGYATSWNRTSVGLNYFFEGHDIKTQVTYRMGENTDGTPGNDLDELFVQFQYVF